jgi:aromatic amino acid aminotransferase I
MPLTRKRALYAVAQKHDLIILEDDPYYFLQLAPYGTATATDQGAGDSTAIRTAGNSTAMQPGTDTTKLTPSFLSIDEDGRVIRLDSFSKLMAPGFRVGIITGPARFMERYEIFAQISSW